MQVHACAVVGARSAGQNVPLSGEKYHTYLHADHFYFFGIVIIPITVVDRSPNLWDTIQIYMLPIHEQGCDAPRTNPHWIRVMDCGPNSFPYECTLIKAGCQWPITPVVSRPMTVVWWTLEHLAYTYKILAYCGVISRWVEEKTRGLCSALEEYWQKKETQIVIKISMLFSYKQVQYSLRNFAVDYKTNIFVGQILRNFVNV